VQITIRRGLDSHVRNVEEGTTLGEVADGMLASVNRGGVTIPSDEGTILEDGDLVRLSESKKGGAR